MNPPDTKPDRRFLNFPVIMIRGTVTEPSRALKMITCWCLVDYARHTRRPFVEALAQLAYSISRRPNERHPSAVRYVASRADVAELFESADEAWAGDGNFPENFIRMHEESPVDLDADDREAIIQWDAVNGAAKFFGRAIKDHDSVGKAAAAMQQIIAQHEAETGAVAKTSVPADLFWQACYGDPDLETMRIFRVVTAVRSLVGKKLFTGTTKNMIRARMVGAKSPAIASMLAERFEAVRDELEALQSRKRFDRIIREGAVRGFYTKYGWGQRLYLSTAIKDHDKLHDMIEARVHRHRCYKATEQAARSRGSKGAAMGSS